MGPEMIPERVGSIQDHYDIDPTVNLGSGVSGCEVFYARDKISKQRRAVKKTKPVDATSKERFKKEVQIMRGLDHPNICKFFDSFDAGDGGMFLVMDVCHGSSILDRITNEGKTSEAGAVEVVKQVAAALKYA